jgi:ribosomal protein S18 acetylase RimI-like enzyme
MNIRPLTNEDFGRVYAAFLEAFSDYLVKLSPSREQFSEMLTRRGYVANASVGAFDSEQLVAFALNGIQGERAYNTGTGTVPSFRRSGLGTAVIERSYSLLRSHGCTKYLLEVIEANTAAASLYLASGFVETRKLQCWLFESSEAPATGHFELSNDWTNRQNWWTVNPAWQNCTASIHRARDKFIALGDEQSYAILFPSSGDLPQLAVEPANRRKGKGTHLLNVAAAIAGKPLRIMNVDDNEASIARFLEHAGAKRTIRQIEMERHL